MIKVLLWDIDGTLLNFQEAEKCAIRSCFAKHGLGECSDAMLARYSKINRGYWERLERGELTKEEVLVGRFREFFKTEGLDASVAERFNADYQIRLGDTICFCDEADRLVMKLMGRVKQYAVTNGTKIAQERKLKNSGLERMLDGVFISDVIGVEKPNSVFFDAVFKEISAYSKEEVLIVGDSLTSDIRGGNMAGIHTCWYNPAGTPGRDDIKAEFEIKNLWEVEEILIHAG